MAIREVGGRKCPETGLAIPECSCQRCLEIMLCEFSPELISDQIRVTRRDSRPHGEPGEHREVA